LEKVREYLDANIKVTEPKPKNNWQSQVKNEIDETYDKWKDSDYLNYEADEWDKKCLAGLLNNYRSQSNQSKCYLSLEQGLSLVTEVWKKCKYKKFISVRPALSPVALINYCEEKNNNKLEVGTEPIVAKTYSLQTFICNNLDFEKYKDFYAHSLAEDIDSIISELLPRISFEAITDLASDSNRKEIGKLYDYIIGPKSFLDKIQDIDIIKIEGNICLNENSFIPEIIAGKFPKSILHQPIFAPYLLFFEGPTTFNGNKVKLLTRVGLFPKK
jgi:hypothetical protein